MTAHELPVPPHFVAEKMEGIWRVAYQERAEDAAQWARRHGLSPAAEDRFTLCLLAVDVQNTFCTPGFELFVRGRSGTGAVDDNRRLCAFLYRNLGIITRVIPTMDTHFAMQIFHPACLVDREGRHPAPSTTVTLEDLNAGRWTFNPQAAAALGLSPAAGREYLLHYTRKLKESGRYDLTIWPYHAMLGGIGHALVSAFEEAVFFHALARMSQPAFQIKGSEQLTEHYSVLGPEVREGPEGRAIAGKNQALVDALLQYDAVVVAGQAKSHCVAWTVDDLLGEIILRDPSLAGKVYLLEDCTSPVVLPGIMDFTDQADRTFRRFAEAGMHIVRSSDPVENWPGIRFQAST